MGANFWQRNPVVERERAAFGVHRAALRGSALPPPKASAPTFLHGFFLLFTLIAATLRDSTLRTPYLKLLFWRGSIVVIAGVLAVSEGKISKDAAKADHAHQRHAGVHVTRSKDKKPSEAVKVDVPGVHVDIDGERADVSVLGISVPVEDDERIKNAKDKRAATTDAANDTEKPSGPFARAWEAVGGPVRFLFALIAYLSVIEFIVVFLSRRWDDWLGFYASRLAGIRPEDETPKEPKIAFDLRWLFRKGRRRLRGYLVFAAGAPALLPLNLTPTIGPWLWTLALTLWGWYWLGVFSAAKSAHAWADEETAPSPRPIRALNDRVARGRIVAPLRWYGRLWAWITREMNPVAATFERSPAAFLGLALARAIFALPGFYLLARPVVPIAAGRLCAEADPADRFSQPPSVTPARG